MRNVVAVGWAYTSLRPFSRTDDILKANPTGKQVAKRSNDWLDRLVDKQIVKTDSGARRSTSHGGDKVINLFPWEPKSFNIGSDKEKSHKRALKDEDVLVCVWVCVEGGEEEKEQGGHARSSAHRALLESWRALGNYCTWPSHMIILLWQLPVHCIGLYFFGEPEIFPDDKAGLRKGRKYLSSL